MSYVLDDVYYNTNIFYDNTCKTFNTHINTNEFTIIEEPVIIIHSLDACYSHALLDRCFPVFWVIQDLINCKIIKDNKVRIFILEKSIKENPEQFMPWKFINDVERKYNGTWHDIISLITPFPVLFQHLLDKKYLFKQYFKYPEHDFWQRTPWNCIHYYPGRNVQFKDIRFNDNIIYNKLSLFRQRVFDYIGLKERTQTNNNLIIIDRKHNRKLDNLKLTSLLCEANKNINWLFKGVFILEDMTFKEQVELFSNSHIIIARHGSSLINLLFLQNNSIVFDIGGGYEGVDSPSVMKRITKFTESSHNYLHYDTFDAKKDIFDTL